MIRTIVQLTPEQAQAAKRFAAERGVSFSELMRRSLDTYMRDASLADQRKEALQRSLAAVGTFHSGVGDLAENHDKYAAEAYEQ